MSAVKTVFLVLLVFLLLAPPLGAVVFIALMGTWLTQMGVGENAPEGLPQGLYAMGLFVAVPLSYWFGGFPALLLGLFFGLWQGLYGRIGFSFAALVGIAGGMLFAAATYMPAGMVFARREFAVLTLCVLVPTLCCWYLTRNVVILKKVS